MPGSSRPRARQTFGSWVLLPEPVSPATTTTALASMSSAMSSTWALIGSSAGNETAGTGAAGTTGGRHPRGERRQRERLAAPVTNDNGPLGGPPVGMSRVDSVRHHLGLDQH